MTPESGSPYRDTAKPPRKEVLVATFDAPHEAVVLRRTAALAGHPALVVHDGEPTRVTHGALGAWFVRALS